LKTLTKRLVIQPKQQELGEHLGDPAAALHQQLILVFHQELPD
jgi:hypothetical protein